NPMAVELCKVSLWMEAMEPGRPLAFLEHRILAGNSLLGATPSLLADGIPDDAFNPIEGDEKEVASALRKQNRRERAGQMSFALAATEAESTYGSFGERITSLDAVTGDTISGIREKEDRLRRFAESDEYGRAKLIAD